MEYYCNTKIIIIPLHTRRKAKHMVQPRFLHECVYRPRGKKWGRKKEDGIIMPSTPFMSIFPSHFSLFFLLFPFRPYFLLEKIGKSRRKKSQW